MTKIILRLSLTMILIYLLASVKAASLYITQWNSTERLISIIFTVLALIAIILHEEFEDD